MHMNAKELDKSRLRRAWQAYLDSPGNDDDAMADAISTYINLEMREADIERLQVLANECGAAAGQTLISWAISEIRRQRAALERINRLTSPGHRTFDELIRDTVYACDAARAALGHSAPVDEGIAIPCADAKVLAAMVGEFYHSRDLSPEEESAFLTLCSRAGIGRPVRAA